MESFLAYSCFPLTCTKRKTHDLHLSGKTLCLIDSHFNVGSHVFAYKSNTLKALRNKQSIAVKCKYEWLFIWNHKCE